MNLCTDTYICINLCIYYIQFNMLGLSVCDSLLEFYAEKSRIPVNCMLDFSSDV